MITLIDAGPGSGKTRVLTLGYMMLSKQIFSSVSATKEQEEIYSYMMEHYSKIPSPDSICFFTHSNSSKDTIIDRIGKKAKIYTFHGAGMSAIIKRYGYQKLVNYRTDRHIEIMTGLPLRSMSWKEKRGWYGIKRILHYFKIEALEATQESLDYILLKYSDLSSYTIPSDWLEVTTELLATSFIPDGEVEFSDMVSMGKRAITKPRFTLGLVDESQDVSQASYQLVTRMCQNVIFAEDKNQAINAFAGASEEMCDIIASKSDLVFPMKLTQRCPELVCDMANSIRPGGIQHGPNKVEGTNTHIDKASLPGKLPPPVLDDGKPSCLFVCRTNAGILSLALFMHKEGIPFSIQNKELHEELIRYIKSFNAKSLTALLDALDKQAAKVSKSSNAMYQQMSMDKISAVKDLVGSSSDYKDLFKLVTRTFTPVKGGYLGTTIHGAKGMEAPNIFIINPPIELGCCMSHPIAKEQEINLHFVAVTRSSQNIWWVK